MTLNPTLAEQFDEHIRTREIIAETLESRALAVAKLFAAKKAAAETSYREGYCTEPKINRDSEEWVRWKIKRERLMAASIAATTDYENAASEFFGSLVAP